MRATTLTAFVSLSLVLVTVPAVANPAGPADATPLASLEVGDVVAVGSLTSDGCHFDEPVLVSVAQPANFTGTVKSSLQVDGDCRARLGSLVVEPARERDQETVASFPPDLVEAVKPLADLDTEGSVVAASSVGSKTVNNRVYHYGTGGHSDVLTQITDEVTFSYDGSQATITDSDPVACLANADWKIDDCQEDLTSSPGDPAYKKSHGDFHWDTWWLPPSYYHTLRSYTGGYGDGQTYCVYGWSGDVTSGVDNDCTVS